MEEDTADAARMHPSGLGRTNEEDRGRRDAIAVDLSQLSRGDEFTPVVEYLTAIQTMRGDGGSLMFVRGADLDAMAERDGRPVPEFLDRLDQLGVVVSSN